MCVSTWRLHVWKLAWRQLYGSLIPTYPSVPQKEAEGIPRLQHHLCQGGESFGIPFCKKWYAPSALEA